jgi:D-alanine-D-alanine ligase
MSQKIKLGLLFGGPSPEHKISIESARMLFYSLKTDQNREKYDVYPFYISETGYFNQFNHMRYASPGIPPEKNTAQRMIPSALFQMDAVFPLMHGKFGEDGTIQGFLSTLKIPYIGSDVLASALSMDKISMKALLSRGNFPVRVYRTVLCGEKPDWEYIMSKMRFPVFVKPSNSGSSIGISKVFDISGLQNAYEEATKWMDRVIIEEGARIRELECGILGDTEPIASPVGEVVYSGEFYDYETKYGTGPASSRLVVPARISEPIKQKVQRMSLEIFRLFNARDMARVDFFYDEQIGDVLVNEINTIPGFTKTSMYPKLWEKAGISNWELSDRLITLAVNRKK